MFYAHFVLAKKGPLARIWLAAHWEGKLTKAHVFETNIEKSVDGILQPKVKMALRTSGHLLLGVVRIYSRKAKYLLADCNEAFVKIKMAFRPGMVDLPEEHREANVNAITLPEVFHDFDTAMPELNDVDIEAQFSLNQTRAEEITMREDYGNINLVVTSDEGFGDMSFDTEPTEIIKTATLEPHLNQAHLLYSDAISEDQMNVDKDKEPQPSTSGSQTRTTLEIDAPIRDDGFGGNLGQDIIAGGLFEDGFFDDTPMSSETTQVDNPMIDHRKSSLEQDDMDDDMGDHYGDTGSMGGHSIDGDSCPSPAQGLILEPPPSEPQLMPPSEQPYSDHMEEHVGSMSNDQTTLLQNEAESFALAPVDVATLKGIVKPRRKRKLIVDEVKNISGEEMKAQLSDTTDIVTTLDLAPPTKRLMHWKETGGVEKLFAVPGRSGFAKALFRLYQRHLTSRSTEIYDTVVVGDIIEEELTFEQVKDPESDLPHIRITRKRKVAEAEEALPQQEQLNMQLMLPTPQTYVLPDMSTVVPPQPATSQGYLPPATSQSTVVPPQPATSQGYLPPATSQPEVPDMSTIDPVHLASMVPTSVVPPPTPNIPVSQSVPPQLNLDVEMPLLPPDQVHSILDQTEHLPGPAVTEQIPPLQPAQEEPPANMENMGYDANNPAMANMGYDGQAAASQTGDKGAGTPWNEDYEFPASVGPPEEQQTDETYEQFEERVLNKRAGQMYHIVKNKLLRSEQLYLSEMTQRNNRKQAAQKFYTLLVLKKHMVLELTQEHSYDEIMITRGNKFDNPSL